MTRRSKLYWWCKRMTARHPITGKRLWRLRLEIKWRLRTTRAERKQDGEIC